MKAHYLVSDIEISIFDSYLENKGYKIISEIERSRLINVVLHNQKKQIIKRDPMHSNQTYVENEILQKFSGLERIPKK